MLCGFTNVHFEKKQKHLKSSYSVSWGPITFEEFVIILLYYFICPLLQIQIEVHIGLNHPFFVGYGATFYVDDSIETDEFVKNNND